MRLRSLVIMVLLGSLPGGLVAAQSLAPDGRLADARRLDAADHAARLARIALTGDLGLPMLPPVHADSPRDELLYADRFPVGQEAGSSAADGEAPVIQSGWIPPGTSGTGTSIGELFRYQVPVGYVPGSEPVPLVIAYHGYGASASSVEMQTTIDEEANARGWFYMSPTGQDDQLFGPPGCQQNVQAAIQWMLDQYDIDEDRLYMVGFSMGGGVVANYAARRRDPDGMMIAALGVVSGTFDWEQTYNTGTSGLQVLMENPYNFGGSPNAEPFRYHQASDLRFLPSTYPPLPGTLSLEHSMATNLGGTPTYVVWDTGDPLVDVLNQGPHFVATLQAQGGVVDFHTVSGTVDPVSGNPASHSWAVLDEVALFDFFADKLVDRTPAAFSAQLDLSADVAWLHLDQRFLEMFSFVDGDVSAGALVVDAVANSTYVEVDFARAGLAGDGPFDVFAASGTAGKFELRVTNLDCPPAYFLDAGTGQLLPGTASDPLTGTLMRQVVASTRLDAQLVCEPNWTTKITTAPNPTTPGGAITFAVDAPETSVFAFLVVGVTDQLVPIQAGNKVAVSLAPPALLLPFTLDGSGDLGFPAAIPTGALYNDTEFLLQAIALDGGGAVDSISNLWRLRID